jgi:hypothetical protein
MAFEIQMVEVIAISELLCATAITTLAHPAGKMLARCGRYQRVEYQQPLAAVLGCLGSAASGLLGKPQFVQGEDNG